jgi:hypothetical protein
MIRRLWVRFPGLYALLGTILGVVVFFAYGSFGGSERHSAYAASGVIIAWLLAAGIMTFTSGKD